MAEHRERTSPDRGDSGESSHLDESPETLEELELEAAERNPDRTTRREALELELEEEGRSDLGTEIGDEMS
jgi:hypothetical protein